MEGVVVRMAAEKMVVGYSEEGSMVVVRKEEVMMASDNCFHSNYHQYLHRLSRDQNNWAEAVEYYYCLY